MATDRAYCHNYPNVNQAQATVAPAILMSTWNNILKNAPVNKMELWLCGLRLPIGSMALPALGRSW